MNRLAVLLLTLALASGVGRAANIVVNPGFETGALSPWANGSGTPVEAWNVTSADAHTGIYSATNVGNSEIVQMFTPTLGSLITSVSLWMKQPEQAISQVGLLYSDASLETDVLFLSTSDWEFFDITALVNPAKTLVGISIFGYAGGGPNEDRTFLDDVTVEARSTIPEPASATLVIGALLGLALKRASSRASRVSR